MSERDETGVASKKYPARGRTIRFGEGQVRAALGDHLPKQFTVLLRIWPIKAGRSHDDGNTTSSERAAMRLGIDAPGATRQHRHAGLSQFARQLVREMRVSIGRMACPDDGH